MIFKRMSTFTFTGSEILRYRLYTFRQKSLNVKEQGRGKMITTRRAFTAPVDAKQREKIRLIGALRRFIRPETHQPASRNVATTKMKGGAWAEADTGLITDTLQHPPTKVDIKSDCQLKSCPLY